MTTPKAKTKTAATSAQSAADRKAAEATLRGLIAKFSPTQSRLVTAVRRALRTRMPTAHELIYEYRDCFVVSISPSERGYEGVFSIRGSAEDVRLYFNGGKGMKDPDKLLQGTANKVRWIPLASATTLTQPAVAKLIDTALANNKIAFARTGTGSVFVQSLASQKPKRK